MAANSNKVEMSLDDIIKANKKKDKSVGKKGAAKGKNSGGSKTSSFGILRRGKRIAKPQRNGAQRINARKASRPVMSKSAAKNPGKTSTVATKRLVQKLVKKALAQSNVRTRNPLKVAQRPKFRAARMFKKSVVVNRLKLSPKSRVISRRRRVVNAQQVVAVRGRGPVRFTQGLRGAPLIRQLNYAAVTQRPVVRPVPRAVVQQRPQRQFVPQQRRQFRMPVYQIASSRPSVRDHISLLRSSVAGGSQQLPRVVYVPQQRVPRQRRQNFQKQQMVFQQPQRVFQQQISPRRQQRSFQNQQQQRQIKREPFFEPPNFLQRIPANQFY